ncbi:hypothetical protein HAX54_006001 [Datura stramonium]|uniref:TF-B3 domain-containing protein n=1 Tax=Datura stramonium TaxID=4076 RepID=A0ABS8RHV9_DATST|nr:hypothetical protein [Datura stramonium]
MKVPPKKPHFFKPVLAGFKNGLKIPIGFLKYVKKQDQYEHATLRRAGKKWLMKVNGRRLEEGNWKVFVEEHDLQLGDLLVFRHEGDMEFEVSIFDSSHCNREYAEYLREEDEDKEEEDEEVDEEENGEEEDDEEDKEENEEEEEEEEEEDGEEDDNEEDKEEEEEEEEEEDEDEDEAFGQSHFVCIIRQYCLSRGYIFLPQKFALANGLTNKKCWLIVRDERQRSWTLKLSSSNSTRTRAYIGDGWRKFAAENNLKEGDCIIFEIVTNGETPIWKFRVVTNGETPMRKFRGKFLIL